MEKDGERVGLDGSGEGVDRAEAELIPACNSGKNSSSNGDPAEWLAGAARFQAGLGEHD
jgi:hypothetical protein